jgi:hypothetical protein
MPQKINRKSKGWLNTVSTKAVGTKKIGSKIIYRLKKVYRIMPITPQQKYKRRIKTEQPWLWHYWWAKDRCASRPKMSCYKHYAGKGIFFLLTKRQIKLLWLRDQAHKLFRPSLDRIDAEIGYEYFNCRFIEYTENSWRALNGK